MFFTYSRKKKSPTIVGYEETQFLNNDIIRCKIKKNKNMWDCEYEKGKTKGLGLIHAMGIKNKGRFSFIDFGDASVDVDKIKYREGISVKFVPKKECKQTQHICSIYEMDNQTWKLDCDSLCRLS